MATADKLQTIIDNTNEAIVERDSIAESIRGKGVPVPVGAKLNTLAGYADQIKQGGTPTPPSPTGLWLNIIYLTDSEGYMVMRQPISRGETVTLPDIDIVPESTVFDENWHPAMTFRRWAYAGAYMTNIGSTIVVPDDQILDITVGAIYSTTDNCEYVIVNIPNDGHILYNTNFTSSTNKDWGDGTSDNGNNHTYAKRGLYKIKVYGASGVTRVNNRATSIWLSSNVQTFANNAFQASSLLKNLNIPPRISAIPQYCFQNCFSLATIILPELEGGIGNYAFQYCYNLEAICFSALVLSFGQDCFNSCTSWALVNAPLYCESIGKGVFSAVKMSKMEISAQVTALLDYTFYQNEPCIMMVLKSSTPPVLGTNRATPNITCVYVVPEGSRDTYIAATNWAALAPFIVENTAEFRATYNF